MVDHIQLIPTRSGEHPEICGMIDAIGEPQFNEALLAFLSRCGAEHCGLFELTNAAPKGLAYASSAGSETARRQVDLYLRRQYWRYDPCVAEAERMIGRSETILIRQSISELTSSALRTAVYGPTHIRERLVLCRSDETKCMALSLLRSDPETSFGPSEIEYLSSVAETLFSVLRKHAVVISGRAAMTEALTSLDEIERCILETPVGLTKREAQVCARILFGLSAIGISSDLGIGEETITTYRKRAYQRLNIATRQELLMWYLGQWRAYDQGSRMQQISTLQ